MSLDVTKQHISRKNPLSTNFFRGNREANLNKHSFFFNRNRSKFRNSVSRGSINVEQLKADRSRPSLTVCHNRNLEHAKQRLPFPRIYVYPFSSHLFFSGGEGIECVRSNHTRSQGPRDQRAEFDLGYIHERCW